MAYLSRNDIEDIAVRFTNDYQRLSRFDDFPADWIDPHIFAHDLCGLNIDYYHLSDDRSILGLTAQNAVGVEVKDDQDNTLIYYLDGKTILIEKALQEDVKQQGRHNFTVMHEVSHQILGWLFPTLPQRTTCRIHYGMAAKRQHRSITDWDEWQADTLASALLMPVNLVKTALNYVGLNDGIDTLNRIKNPAVYSCFCKMADFLGVSKQELSIRLKQLGLLKENELRNPHGRRKAVLVFMDKEEAGDI